MQPRPGCETQPCDVPRIRRNLRLDKHDMNHDGILRESADRRNAIQRIVPRGTWTYNRRLSERQRPPLASLRRRAEEDLSAPEMLGMLR